MASKLDQSNVDKRRFYPPAPASSGNFLNDAALRSVRAVFRKSVKGSIKDGSLQALLDEMGYKLVKRSKQKAKAKPHSKPTVVRKRTTSKKSD